MRTKEEILGEAIQEMEPPHQPREVNPAGDFLPQNVLEENLHLFLEVLIDIRDMLRDK